MEENLPHDQKWVLSGMTTLLGTQRNLTCSRQHRDVPEAEEDALCGYSYPCEHYPRRFFWRWQLPYVAFSLPLHVAVSVSAFCLPSQCICMFPSLSLLILLDSVCAMLEA